MQSNILEKALENIGSFCVEELTMTKHELAKYLNKIKQVFDLDELLRQEIDQMEVVDYYVQSEAGYRFFHSSEGAIHLALNYDRKFDKEGYYGQAKIIQKHITELCPQRVLELGSGKGFNTIYLARKNKDVEFIGIDITHKYVKFAQTQSQGLANLHFVLGDFHKLNFVDESFDLVFEVESVCHAYDMSMVLSEIYRVLKPKGRFISFDGYRKAGFDQFDDKIKLAARLVEVAMAISRPWLIDDWLYLAQKIGFEILSVDELSEAIMPNLLKFQRLAKGYFKFTILSRALLRILPPKLVKNSIAGLLMPFTIKAGAHGYYNIVLKRP
jgi:ubiquinone/menaquinone biosynthesis C-methylase UbiE